MKNKITPKSTREEVINPELDFSNDSGIKCKNAPPKREPAESETRNKIILLSLSFFNKTKNIPTREINETTITLSIEYTSGFIEIIERMGF